MHKYFSSIKYQIINNDIIIDNIDELDEIVTLELDNNDLIFNDFLRKYGEYMNNLTEITTISTKYTLKVIPKTVKSVFAQIIDPENLWEIEELTLRGTHVYDIKNVDLTALKYLHLTKYVNIDLSLLINLETFAVDHNVYELHEYIDFEIPCNKLINHRFYLGISYDLPDTLKELRYFVRKIVDISHIQLNKLELCFCEDLEINLTNEHVKKLEINFYIDVTHQIDLNFPNNEIVSVGFRKNENKIKKKSKTQNYEMMINGFDSINCKAIFLYDVYFDVNLEFNYIEKLTIVGIHCDIFRLCHTVKSKSIRKFNFGNNDLKFYLPNLENFEIFQNSPVMDISNMSNNIIEHMSVVICKSSSNNNMSELMTKNLIVISYCNVSKVILPKNYEHLTLINHCELQWITHELETLVLKLLSGSFIGDKIFRPNLKKISSNIDFHKWIDVSDDCEIIMNCIKEKD